MHKIIHWGFTIAVILGTASGGEIGPVKAHLRSNREKDKIIEEAVHQWDDVSRWLIEYDCVERPGPPDVHVRMVMATGSPGLYYKLKAHETKDYPWHADPFQEESFISDGLRCVRWPFSRMYKEIPIKPGDTVEGTIRVDILWRVMPQCPMSLYRIPDLELARTSPVIGRALKSSSCQLLEGTEAINGESCLVYIYKDNNAIKKTWIAKRLGLCLMKEEIRYIEGNGLVQRILTDKTGAVGEGKSIPVDYRVQWFMGDGKEDTPEREVRVHILRCLFNEAVTDSTFVPMHAKGSIKEISSTHSIQDSPGGEELLLDLVRYMTN